MAGGKETGRQKMIGMMYLVLTALLALNVSKDILEAFAMIDEGIVATNESFTTKIDDQYAAFKAAYDKNPAKVEEYWKQAQSIKSEADETVKYLTTLKAILFLNSERGGTKLAQIADLKDDPELSKYLAPNENGVDTVMSVKLYEKKDDYDTPTFLLFGDNLDKPREGEWSGIELQAKLESFKANSIASINGLKGFTKVQKQAQIDAIEKIFNFEQTPDHDGVMQDWAFHLFDHIPIAGVQAVLSKVQSDIKAVESDMLKLLASRIDAADFKVSSIVPVVSMGKTLLAPGDSFKAEVILAAYDDTKDPEIYISQRVDADGKLIDGEKLDVRAGKGIIGKKVGANGSFDWKGVLKMADPLTGQMQDYPFEFGYKVSNAEAVIDPSKLNVLYRTLANPLTVSVPGADSDNISISVTGGCKIKKIKGGSFEVTPPKTLKTNSTVTVSVSVRKDGRTSSKGSKVFKIKTIPDPFVTFVGNDGSDGTMDVNLMKRGTMLKAKLDENFLFDGISWNVKSYKVTINSGGDDYSKTVSGERLPGDVTGALASLKPGARITFSSIICKSKSGEERLIKGNLSLKAI
jgi:gliding motility-associated protein GldM